jgi:hypothetical protein
MGKSQNTDSFERELKRLIRKLENERHALNKILQSVGKDDKQKNQTNKLIK